MVKIFSLLAEILKSMDKKRDVQPNTSDMPELEKTHKDTILPISLPTIVLFVQIKNFN